MIYLSKRSLFPNRVTYMQVLRQQRQGFGTIVLHYSCNGVSSNYHSGNIDSSNVQNNLTTALRTAYTQIDNKGHNNILYKISVDVLWL